MLRSALALCALLCLGACRGPTSNPAGGSDLLGPCARDVTLVTLVTGTPPAPLTEERRAELFRGHFSNMAAMAAAGDLLLAGPFGEDKARSDWRGLFFMRHADVAAGLEAASADPTTRAGVFALEGATLRTATDFAAYAELLERAAAARAGGDGPAAPAPDVRAFALATAEDPAALAVLARSAADARVLVAGFLDGRSFAILDAERTDEARELLAEAAGAHDWTVSSWWAAGVLAELPRGVAGGRAPPGNAAPR